MTATKKTVDMTSGSTVRHIITFAIPLLIGNLFQQLYNTVDTWVVGNFATNEAFSAVGNVGPIINMLVGFFVGFSSGVGVVISQFYGAKQYDRVSDTVHTAIAMTAILGAIFMIVGYFVSPLLLLLMKMPESVFAEAKTYLAIYFLGILGLMIYNIGSGILRAVGDSKRPFYYLVVAAAVNTVLDLVFVIFFNMGVAGVALATVIAQGTSAVLVMVKLLRTDACIKLIPRYLKIDFSILSKIFRVGIPAALQTTLVGFSNIFVQSYINFFGEDFMSGYTAYSKIDQILLLPMQSIALASTTFVGQNIGKGQSERARRGIWISLGLSLLFTGLLMIPVIGFAPSLTAFFNPKPEVVEYGALLLRLITPFYLLCCINQVLAGSIRGAGKSLVPMIIMLSSFVGARQLYLFVVANFISNTVVPIALAYPFGWLCASVATLIYYKFCNFDSALIK